LPEIAADALEPECRERKRKSNTGKMEDRKGETERKERRWLGRAAMRRRSV
jgi:hypothetical protein